MKPLYYTCVHNIAVSHPSTIKMTFYGQRIYITLMNIKWYLFILFRQRDSSSKSMDISSTLVVRTSSNMGLFAP